MSLFTELLLLALLWVVYFAVHSLLASLWVKTWLAQRAPTLLPAYRLLFNLIATVLLIPIVLLIWQSDAPPLWAWRGIWGWLADGLALAILGGFIWTMGHYQGMDFLGLSQWRTGQSQIEDTEGLSLSPLHRVVRHPWYFLSLLLIWSRDMPPAMLISAVAISLYLVVGSWLEEAKLVRRFGAAYERYQQQVPGLVPIPGRRLSAEEAQALLAEANRRTDLN